MKKQLKLGLLAGGIMLGASSLVSLTTYADTTNVTVTVDPTITLSAASSASVTAKTNSVEDMTFTATVTANKSYKISLSATKPQLTLNDAAAGSDNTKQIPAASTLTAGTNGWGIHMKSANDSDTDAAAYTAITSTPVPFYTSTSGRSAKTTTFKAGVAIAPSLAAGAYKTAVTVTAATY